MTPTQATALRDLYEVARGFRGESEAMDAALKAVEDANEAADREAKGIPLPPLVYTGRPDYTSEEQAEFSRGFREGVAASLPYRGCTWVDWEGEDADDPRAPRDCAVVWPDGHTRGTVSYYPRSKTISFWDACEERVRPDLSAETFAEADTLARAEFVRLGGTI